MGVRKPKRVKPKRIKFPLRQILRNKGLTQYRCSQITGITQQQISDICCGRKLPSWPMLLHICTSLEVDLGELVPKGGAA